MQNSNISFYDQHAQTWWEGSQKFQRLLLKQVSSRFAYFDRVTTDWNGITVLDLGCGGGFMSEALAHRGAHVIGVDPSIGSLEAARKHAGSQRLEIEYREGIGEAIPLKTDSVDRVVCVDVLEHVENVAGVIKEIRRVLRTGGIFLFDTVNRTLSARFFVIFMMENILRLLPRGAHESSKFVCPIELKKYLAEAGFHHAGDFAGIRLTLNRRFGFEFELTASTNVLYIGYAK